MYELIFEPNEQDRQRFEICHQAVLMYPDKISRDIKPDVLSLMKKLNSISDESGQMLGGAKLRDLSEDGGTILLENSEFRFLLDKAVCAEIWRPQALEAQDQTEQWLRGLAKVKLQKVQDNAESTRAIGG